LVIKDPGPGFNPKAPGLVATDDATLLEAIGSLVVVLEGEVSNFKITTPEDLARAEESLR